MYFFSIYFVVHVRNFVNFFKSCERGVFSCFLVEHVFSLMVGFLGVWLEKRLHFDREKM